MLLKLLIPILFLQSVLASIDVRRPPKAKHCFGEHEEYSRRAECSCDDKLCNACPQDFAALQWGCKCIHGFYRNHEGECVSETECRLDCKVRGEFEECKCGTACHENCDGVLMDCPAKRAYHSFCQEGYLRNFIGICVPKCDCVPQYNPECCGENEVYTCDTCDTDACPDAKCGCNCKDGYEKNSDGACVEKVVEEEQQQQEEEQSEGVCEKECNGLHEHFDECGSGCYHESCTQYSTLKRRADNTACTDVCVPGCYCDPGYCRDADNECVPVQPHIHPYPHHCPNCDWPTPILY